MIGRSIRKLRKQKKMRLEDVAQACGVTAVTISRYERGEREPSPEMLSNIAAAIGVTVADINQLADRLAPALNSDLTSPPSTGHVTTEAAMATWMNRVITEGPDDPNLKLLLFVLQNYIDKTSWVVSGTIPQIAASASLPVGMVEDLWEELLGSPFVERVGTGEWTLRLVMPDNQQ